MIFGQSLRLLPAIGTLKAIVGFDRLPMGIGEIIYRGIGETCSPAVPYRAVHVTIVLIMPVPVNFDFFRMLLPVVLTGLQYGFPISYIPCLIVGLFFLMVFLCVCFVSLQVFLTMLHICCMATDRAFSGLAQYEARALCL